MKKIYYTRLSIALIVLLVSITAPLGFFDIQLAPLFQRVLNDFSIIALITLLGIIIITLLFGRFYCSTICPFGILQEVFLLLLNKKGAEQKNLPYKYFVLALSFGALTAGSAIIIRQIDPYTIFSSAVSLSAFGLIVTGVVFVLVFFKKRFFCSNICPVGALLGLVSKLSVNKIYIKDNCVSCGLCKKACPTGSIGDKTIDNETCVKCLRCFKECKKGAIAFGTKKPSFNPKRRDFIISAAALAVFLGALRIGIKKVKNMILPAGAKNADYMANKCLNCNACINNCPSKILAKANEDFPAVHIDYSKGDGYCKYDCNNCSKMCPSGAIKKISLEEKQNTRIAMAVIKDSCVKCGACVHNCPKGAITKENDKIILDSQKCIGCAKCKTVCRFDAIEIYPINEQQII